jgi:hypothetical protein
MKRKMEQVEISVTEAGRVLIEQPDPMDPDRGGCVELEPDQIDMVCDWLKEARAEAMALRATDRAVSR